MHVRRMSPKGAASGQTRALPSSCGSTQSAFAAFFCEGSGTEQIRIRCSHAVVLGRSVVRGRWYGECFASEYPIDTFPFHNTCLALLEGRC